VPERALTALLLALFLAWEWSEVEQPATPLSVSILLVAAAVLPAMVFAAGRRLLGAGLALGGAVAAVAAATGFNPWERNHPFYVTRLVDEIHDGIQGWLSTTTPIDVGRFPEASADVRLALFALLAGMAWLLLVARRPVATVAVAFGAFAVPVTVLVDGGGAWRAAIFLALALLVLAVCRPGSLPRHSSAAMQLALLGALAIGTGLVLSSAPGVSKAAFLNWETWNPLASDQPRVSVGYVWDQSYKPLRWPKTRTVVLEVRSPRPLYWKVAVLDDFVNDHWQSRPVVEQAFTAGTDTIGIPESLRPTRAIHPEDRDVVELKVKVRGLADPHLVTTGQPLSWTLDRSEEAALNLDGTASLSEDPSDGTEYTTRAYAPDPTPKALAAAGTVYPAVIRDGIRIGSGVIPVWGSGSTALPVSLPQSYIAASDEVWQRSSAGSAVNPYEAVVNVEAYLRSAPFRYDQTPDYRADRPVLVDFLTRSHHGYCQMFSASMALVLRLHGIPARVAVGFTTGREQTPGRGDYVVNDKNAHSWVEVYFPGYGWLPFDPTPTRTLGLKASTANGDVNDLRAIAAAAPGQTNSPVARAAAALGALLPNGGPRDRKLGPGEYSTPNGGRSTTLIFGAQRQGHSFLRWLLLALGVVLAALLLVKLLLVRWRYLRPGPRGVAAAGFHELATFAGDQGMDVSSNLTFEDLAARLEKAYGIDASGFAECASAARYAPMEDAAAAARGVRRQVRSAKRGMRKTLTLRERAAGALRLRTALARGASFD
jgi:transglutaminase-like putative cysteine protease